MALEPCKDCGREVSTFAESCPNCGRPQSERLQKKDLARLLDGKASRAPAPPRVEVVLKGRKYEAVGFVLMVTGVFAFCLSGLVESVLLAAIGGLLLLVGFAVAIVGRCM